MTGHRKESDRNKTRRERDGSLDLSRSEKFSFLRSALDALPTLTNTQAQNLSALIEILEFKTLGDGRCHLSKARLCAMLRWSASKFDYVRARAEELGWIHVDRNPSRSGGQGVNHIRVAWENVRATGTRNQIDRPPKIGLRPPKFGGAL